MAKQKHDKMKPTQNVGNTRVRWKDPPIQQPLAPKVAVQEAIYDSDDGPFVLSRAERQTREAKEKRRRLNSQQDAPRRTSRSGKRGDAQRDISPVNLDGMLAQLTDHPPDRTSSTSSNETSPDRRLSNNISSSHASGSVGRKRRRGEDPEEVIGSPKRHKLLRSSAWEIPMAKPERHTYGPIPENDMSDEWFRKALDGIHERTLEVVEEYFIVPGFEDAKLKDIRDAPEFVFWAEQSARGDPNNGGWEKLLQNPTQRKFLIAAILVRLFKVKIFDVYLWGANEPQHQLLHNIDRTFFDHDGFFRTDLRSDMARKIVGREPVTELFWEEVEKLTEQTIALLKPLTNHLHPRGKVNVSLIEDQIQAIHDLISDAAHLSIRMRMSPTIFFWVNATPGTRYNKDDHVNADGDSWRESKHAIRDHHENRHRAYTTQKKAAKEKYWRFTNEGQEDTRRAKVALRRLNRIKQQKPVDPSFDHVPMVKIGVWPSIRRFKPGSAADERIALKMKVPLAAMRGSREHEICKASVVCYYGKSTETYGERERLDELIKKKWGSGRLMDLNMNHGVQEVVAAAVASMVGVVVWTIGR